MKRLLLQTAAILLAAVVFVMPADALSLSARKAVLMDASTGRVLWEKSALEPGLIASTTKIMTGLLIAEDCSLEDRVNVPAEAVGIEGSSLYLAEGEILTVETLLYGMMLHSGNDAATALAIFHSGSTDAFVDAMNEKACALALTQTHFANPHGLDSEENFASARDLARLAAYAMENPVFQKVVSTRSISMEGRVLTNHNKLLAQYEGAMGVKTGYTKAAGRILVSCAQRDGRRLIAVTMDAPRDWQDHRQLLDYGFETYDLQPVLKAGQIVGQVPVISGGEETAHAVPRDDFSCLLTEGESVTLEPVLPDFVYAPLLAGDPAGYLRITINGEVLSSVPLFWRYSVLERE